MTFHLDYLSHLCLVFNAADPDLLVEPPGSAEGSALQQGNFSNSCMRSDLTELWPNLIYTITLTSPGIAIFPPSIQLINDESV